MSPRPSGNQAGETREKIFEFVKDRILNGHPPTVREVQEAFGFRAVQSARQHLEKLVSEGRLLKTAGVSRGYSLPSLQMINLPSGLGQFNPDAMIPILGRVQAGALTTANQEVEGYIDYSQAHNYNSPREELFALRVQGESMIGAGIYPNDVVIVRWQSDVRNGDIVVGLVGEEATVKTYWRKGDVVELRPENPDFPVIRPNPEELSILGKVVELRRHFESFDYSLDTI